MARAWVTVALLVLATAPLTVPLAAQPGRVFYSWSPKAEPDWTAPNRPVWRLADVLPAHKGQSDWTQALVHDQDFDVRYVSLGPGGKTRPQFWADDRVFWYVASGQIRFHIDGLAPFVASKGWLVQVPWRTSYWMETVGGQPSLRLGVIHAGRTPLYPADGPAPAAKDKAYVLASTRNRPDRYGAANPAFLDFWGDFIRQPLSRRNTNFLSDPVVQLSRAKAAPPPPHSNKGHFHIDYGEVFLVAEGSVDYKLEGMALFTATTGDVIYAPRGRRHRVNAGGTGMSTRIATMLHANGMHNFDPETK